MMVIESAIRKLREAPTLGGYPIVPDLTVQELESLIAASELLANMARAVQVGAEVVIK